VWEGGAAVPEKCFAVFGILFNISPDAVTPPAIEWLFNSFPEVVGAEAPYPDVTLDLNELLPLDKSYDTYIGSLVRFAYEYAPHLLVHTPCRPLLSPNCYRYNVDLNWNSSGVSRAIDTTLLLEIP
jgi:hypothetical protein